MARSDMDRREALRALVSGAIGAAAVPPWVESLTALAREQAHARGAHAVPDATGWRPRVLTAWQNDAVLVLTELIIPETDTPGARAVGVNRFVDQVLFEAPPAQRDAFFRGLAWMDARSKSLFGRDLLDASAEEQSALLTRVSTDAQVAAADGPGREFFAAIKALTISGYYATEVGLRQELGDDGQLVLAEFKGCDHPEHQ